MRSAHWRMVCAVCGALALCVTVAAAFDDEPALGRPATKAEIVSLIDQLSDPAWPVRSAATRRLSAIGPAAHAEVKAASESEDAETALRARRILEIYKDLLFSNATIALSFSKSTVAWDESVDLMVTITASSLNDSAVPFELDSGIRARLSADALQVADMLDVADWIRVTGPSGNNVELRVDEISTDPDVVSVVQERLNGGPTGTVPAGSKLAFVVRGFNRGWARYPMLEAGEYTVGFEYTPDWSDPVLAEQRVGRVVAVPSTLTVTTAAPAVVSRNGIMADCRLAREGDWVVAYFVNRSDRAAIVNMNFGRSVPFARGGWVYETGALGEEVSVGADAIASWADFAADKLVEVAAGGSVELARIRITELKKRFADAGTVIAPDSGSLHFRYSNTCDRMWQSRERSNLDRARGVPQVLLEILPRQLIATQQASNRLHVSDLR